MARSALTVSTVWLAVSASLGTPVRALGQDRACSDPGTGSLHGIVYDESRTLGLPGVTINVRWADGSAVVQTAPDGTFTACGLPAQTSMTAIANFAGLSSAPFQFTVAAGTTAEHEFLVRLKAAETSAAQHGRVVGSVVDAQSREPVEGAVIGVAGEGFESLTGADGQFVLTNVPEGVQVLHLRHLAYGTQQASVDVRAGAATSVLVEVSRQPIELEPLAVTIEGVRDIGLEIRGFYERQEWNEKLGIGHYFTFEDIERRNPRLISHMIADVPGTVLDCSRDIRRNSCELRFVGAGSACERAGVFINGTPALRPDNQTVVMPLSGEIRPTSLDQLITPREIAGIEIYPSAASVPAEFGGSAGQCGAIIIWTR